MAFVYKELPAHRHRQLDAHLRTCAECQAAVGRWRGAMARLEHWTVPGKSALPQRDLWFPAARWAMAAIVVLGLGFGMGRFTTPQPDLAQLTAAVEARLQTSLRPQLREEVRQEIAADWQAALEGSPASLSSDFRRQLRLGLEDWSVRTVSLASRENERAMGDFLETYQADRQQSKQMLLTLFDRAEQRHQAQHLSLRRALETVAVVAADRFQRTETQLGELASYTQATLLPDETNPFSNSTPSQSNHN